MRGFPYISLCFVEGYTSLENTAYSTKHRVFFDSVCISFSYSNTVFCSITERTGEINISCCAGLIGLINKSGPCAPKLNQFFHLAPDD